VVVQGSGEEMRVKKCFSYFGVVLPWVVVGMPLGLVVPILILVIPILDVPLYHKLVDVVVLLAVSLLLGAMFMAIDNRLEYVNALHKHCAERKVKK